MSMEQDSTDGEMMSLLLLMMMMMITKGFTFVKSSYP